MKEDGTMVRSPFEKHDWTCLDAMSDDEVEAAAIEDPDAQPLTDADMRQMRRSPQERVIRRALGIVQEACKT